MKPSSRRWMVLLRRLNELRKEGYKGCNVTVPFKFEAFQLAAERSDRARCSTGSQHLKFDA